MQFELAAAGILAWLGRIINDRAPVPTELPRGMVIVLCALSCWLAIAALVWAAMALVSR